MAEPLAMAAVAVGLAGLKVKVWEPLVAWEVARVRGRRVRPSSKVRVTEPAWAVRRRVKATVTGLLAGALERGAVRMGWRSTTTVEESAHEMPPS